jgi:hypothetical protein
MPSKKIVFFKTRASKKFSFSKEKIKKIAELSFKYETFVLLKMVKLSFKCEAFIFQRTKNSWAFIQVRSLGFSKMVKQLFKYEKKRKEEQQNEKVLSSRLSTKP